jgi:hypothetical protein
MNFTYEGGELEIHGDVGTVIDMAPAAVTHIMPGAHRQRIPPVTDQLPAIVETAALTTLTDTYIVPALIAAAGDQAGWRYIEFFTANIRNPHTRRAYARACSRFFAWCEDRGQSLASIRPFDVATYIEGLQQQHSAPGVKQQLAALRMLFDWLITGQIIPMNPAAAGARARTRRQDRLDPSARGSRMAQAARFHSGDGFARSARPRIDRRPHL